MIQTLIVVSAAEKNHRILLTVADINQALSDSFLIFPCAAVHP